MNKDEELQAARSLLLRWLDHDAGPPTPTDPDVASDTDFFLEKYPEPCARCRRREATMPDRSHIDPNRDANSFGILKEWAEQILEMDQRRQSGLRTRAEVDREIALRVRELVNGSGGLRSGSPSMREWSEMFNELCAEQTDEDHYSILGVR